MVINETLISKKKGYGRKTHLNTWLGLMLMMTWETQMTGFVKCFDSDKTTLFWVIDKELLKSYIKIWERVNSLIGKGFEIKLVFDDND